VTVVPELSGAPPAARAAGFAVAAIAASMLF
jgi:hypothetical protein